MIKKGSVIVLDYSTEEIHIYKFHLKDGEMENFIKSKGHTIKGSSWMVVDELKLKIHQFCIMNIIIFIEKTKDGRFKRQN